MLQNWGESSGEPRDGPGPGERLQELGLLSLEMRKPKGVRTAVFPASRGARKDTVKEKEPMGIQQGNSVYL